MAKLAFTVSGPPVPWSRPNNKRGGGRLNPPKMRKAEEEIAWEAKKAGASIIDGPVSLWASFFVPIPQSWSKKKRKEADSNVKRATSKPDLSNYIKLVEDALNGVCYHDDAQIVEYGLVGKFYSFTPRTEIIIVDIEEEEKSLTGNQGAAEEREARSVPGRDRASSGGKRTLSPRERKRGKSKNDASATGGGLQIDPRRLSDNQSIHRTVTGNERRKIEVDEQSYGTAGRGTLRGGALQGTPAQPHISKDETLSITPEDIQKSRAERARRSEESKARARDMQAELLEVYKSILGENKTVDPATGLTPEDYERLKAVKIDESKSWKELNFCFRNGT